MKASATLSRSATRDASLDVGLVELHDVLQARCRECCLRVVNHVARYGVKSRNKDTISKPLRAALDRITAENSPATDWRQLNQFSTARANSLINDFIVSVTGFAKYVERFLREENSTGKSKSAFKVQVLIFSRSRSEVKQINLLLDQIILHLGRLSILYVRIGGENFIPKPPNRSGSDISGLEKQFPVSSYSLEGLQSSMMQSTMVYGNFSLSRALRTSPPSREHIERHQRYRSQRVDGTCLWILQNASYQEWVREQSLTTLWLIGKAGCGKSVLSSQVIDKLASSSHSQGATSRIAYFYMVSGKLHTAADIAHSILVQLDVDRITLEDDEGYDFGHRSISRPKTMPLGPILEAFNRLSGSLGGPIYVCIDALDDENVQFPDDFHRLLEKLVSLNWKLFLTRRVGDSWVDARGLTGKSHTIQMDSSLTMDDISVLVKGALSNYQMTHSNSRLPRALTSEVEQYVKKASDGMFLSAALYLDVVLEKHTVSGIRQALTTVENKNSSITALDKIDRLPGVQRDIAIKALVWVANLTWPLRTAGLCEALALSDLKPKQRFDDPQNQELIPLEDKVIGFCESLIARDSITSTVVLAHQETRSVINTKWQTTTESISDTSLKYLLLSDFEDQKCKTEDQLERLLEKYQFLEYAAHSWYKTKLGTEDEVPTVEMSSNPIFKKRTLNDRFLDLLQRPSHLRLALLVLFRSKAFIAPQNNAWREAQERASTTTSIHAVARFGLPKGVLDRLTTRLGEDTTVTFEQRLSAKDCLGRTPLHEAVRKGHIELVSALFSEEAFATSDTSKRLPIHYAFEGASANPNKTNSQPREDFMEIMRCLLKEHANCVARSGVLPVTLLKDVKDRKAILSHFITSNPYYVDFTDAKKYTRAARNRDLAMVLALLEKGIDPNSIDDEKKLPALHLAISKDSGDPVIHLVRAILRAPKALASLVDEGQKKETALQRAVEFRMPEIVRELLQRKDASINHVDSDNLTALHRAVKNNSVELVRLLLTHKANVNEGAVLSRAIRNGNEAIVQLLLNHGANTSTGDKQRPNVLFDALDRSVGMMELLLESRVDIDAIDDQGRTVLLLAAQQGNEPMVKALLRAGADITIKAKGENQDVLHAAKAAGHPEILQTVAMWLPTR